MEPGKHNTRGKRHYCTICSNYRGKMVDGRVVKLHQFPSEPRLLRVWQNRLRLVRKDFKYNAHIRLCSEHFRNGEYTSENPVPCIFANRTFLTSKVKDVTSPGPRTSASETGSTTAMTVDDHGDTCVFSEQETFKDKRNCSVGTSVFLHDYIGEIDFKISKTVDKCEQTTNENLPLVHSETQTELHCFSVSTQTDFRVENEPVISALQEKSYATCSVATQASRPEIAFEDIASSDDKMMFYTGLPNAGTFKTLFDHMDDAFENTQRSATGSTELGGRPRALSVLEEFFLVLMRLRLGLLLEDLAYRFKISKSTCGSIVEKWIEYCMLNCPF